jgi:hypothetical protein
MNKKIPHYFSGGAGEPVGGGDQGVFVKYF